MQGSQNGLLEGDVAQLPLLGETLEPFEGVVHEHPVPLGPLALVAPAPRMARWHCN